MKWSPLPKGRFTGIDWSATDATDGFDPYLVWAEADQFSGFEKHAFRWLSLIIELSPGVTVADFKAAASPGWLHVPPVYTSGDAPAGLSFCTARVKREFFHYIQEGGSLYGLVKRFELGMSLAQGADRPTAAVKPPYGHAADRLKGKVLGVIDGGFAFANANFLARGGTRLKYFWRQDHEGKGPAPDSMQYGHELKATDIDHSIGRNTFNGLVDESGVYRDLLFGMEMEKLVSHGTHVLDLACGPRLLAAQISGADAPPSWADANDDASRAHVVAVQIDWHTVLDTSGGSMNVHLLDGMMYILSRCARNASVAVNLSWGTLAGPHDGTSVLEAAMDQLMDLKSGLLQIVVAAGNGYQDRMHANATLAPKQDITLHWRGQPGDLSQNFLEIWIEEGHQGLEIQLTPPGHPSLPGLRMGEAKMWTGEGDKPLCALIYPPSVATGTRGTCALLAVSATFSDSRKTATAPSGVWQIKLVNRGAAPVTVDAYIERDDEIIGVRTGARQSHFEDIDYDTSGNPDSFVDHPDNPSPIRRSGTFNSIATGARVLTVGGTVISDGNWTRYSPRKPDPDRERRERPGVIKTPDTSAPSDESRAVIGMGAAGTRSGSWVRLGGTTGHAQDIQRNVAGATSVMAAC